jgi:pimeloyl-ACP methyl ester carboxylesterase
MEASVATIEQTRVGQYVNAHGVRTYYEVTGEGDPLILLHGGFCTVETFDAQTPALASS